MAAKNKALVKSTAQIPTKLALAIAAVLVGYGLTQPLLNKQLGWQLPPLASQLDSSKPNNAETKNSELTKDTLPQLAATDSHATTAGSHDPKPAETSSAGNPARLPTVTSSPLGSGDRSEVDSTQPLLYGLLEEVGRQDYVSPGGLRYTRGSAEGHRLAHLEKHLEDDPSRPGKHGVFAGDMPQVLRWLDDTYTLAKQGAKGTSRRTEDRRTVYEANFNRPIGFIGGRDGKRDNYPDAQRIRLVVENNRVITAFPF